ETVETRFFGDLLCVAPKAEMAGADGDDEVLAHLALVQHRADREADLRLGAQCPCPAGCRAWMGARARSAARARLRQTISLSPGNCSGALISARSRSSNKDSCSGPFAAASCWIAGARRQEIQSRPAGFRSASIRAEVSMPRSPTSTTRERPKRCLSLLTWLVSVAGSAVLPSNTSTATGSPSRVHSRP